MITFFGTTEAMSGFISETICKFEERTPDKWADAFKYLLEQGMTINVLKEASESHYIPPEKVLGQQLENKGGQLIEIHSTKDERKISICLCETIEFKLVIVYFKEEVEPKKK